MNGPLNIMKSLFTVYPFIVFLFIVYSLWGFKKVPHEETCVWVLQISVYNYTLGNYDCFTESGFICEIELPTDPWRQLRL